MTRKTSGVIWRSDDDTEDIWGDFEVVDDTEDIWGDLDVG